MRASRLASLAALASLVWLACSREYDRGFDVAVATPAYRGDGPWVLYDEGHRNVHAADGAYRPFVRLLENDGYRVRVVREMMTDATFEAATVLVIVLARGANETDDAPAFSDAEADAIERWVRGGGALLLVTDHWPFGSAVVDLARRFDVQMGAGLVEDAQHHDPGRGASHIVFSHANGLLRDHPIVQGRNDSERLQQILTFTGQSIQGPSGAVSFLALAPTAVEYPPTSPRVERDGGDVRVHMDYGDAQPVVDGAQGIAFQHDQGRVVVLGEAGLLRAQPGKLPVGMNVPPYDNRQLALNLLHWLTRVL